MIECDTEVNWFVGVGQLNVAPCDIQLMVRLCVFLRLNAAS